MVDQVIDLANKEGKVIDLRQEVRGGGVQVQRIDPYSLGWATKVVRPISYFVLILLASVMLIPFLVLLAPIGLRIENLPEGTTPAQAATASAAAMAQRSKDLLDWAKTILPSVVGFGSAMMGYYFGTRSSNEGTKVPIPEPDEQAPDEPAPAKSPLGKPSPDEPMPDEPAAP